MENNSASMIFYWNNKWPRVIQAKPRHNSQARTSNNSWRLTNTKSGQKHPTTPKKQCDPIALSV